MKKILIILIIHCARVALLAPLLIPSTRDCFCQSITWQRVYDCNLAKATARDLCEADGNNFYISGPAGHGQVYMIVVKVNQWGDTIWTNNYGGGRIYAITSSGDGGCVFTGDIGPSFAFKIKQNGDTAWLRFYNGKECFDIKKTNDNGYIMCGTYARGFNIDGYLCKIDSLGNLQWEKTYQGEGDVYFRAIEIDLDGYIIGGSKYYLNQESPYLIKINIFGDTVWSKTFYIANIANIRSLVKKDYGYILTGNAMIYPDLDSIRIFTIKTDNSGNLISSVIYNSNYLQNNPTIIKESNKIFYISHCSNTSNPYIDGSKVIKIDSNLNILKEILILPDTNGLALFSLIKVPNSTDLISCGRTDQFEIQGNSQFYAIRIDSSLSLPPPIGIKEITSLKLTDYQLYQNYPNPFNPKTKIKYDIKVKGKCEKAKVKLIVYDVMGKEIVVLIDEQQSTGTYEVELDGSSLSSGVYFYALFAENYIESKKLILIK